MTADTFTTRNRLMAGLVILLVLVVLIVYFIVTLAFRGTEEQPQVGRRSPVDALTYCGAEQDRLCIINFSQEVDGGMQIYFQTPFAFYPEFVVQIIHDGTESTYECEREEATSTRVICSGDPQVPGEIMEFKVFSRNWGTLLAEGNFAIIGIALFTPEVELTTTGTPSGTLTVTATLTPSLNTRTPTPSYPNPSYPNRTYP